MCESEAAGRYWSNSYKRRFDRGRRYIRWWDVPYINSYLNKKICGLALPGFADGAEQSIYQFNGCKAYKNGVSVGCGSGHKEISLILKGIVEKFTVYDIAEFPLQKARELA